MRYVIRYDDGMYDADIGWPVQISEATVYDTRAEAERAVVNIGVGEVVEHPEPPPKTPEELNAEFERIAADLGDGIAEAVAAAVAEERATVVAFLRSFYLRSYGDICADMADIIERGKHRREESKP